VRKKVAAILDVLFRLGQDAARARARHRRHQDLATNSCARQAASRCTWVSAWAAGQRVVLAQEAVDEKSNEIVAIPLALGRLQLTGALVTIDATGTQTDIAERIVAGGGDYLLVLKAKGSDPVASTEYVNLDRRQSSSAIGRGSMPTPAHHEASSP
jgi:hypothetical protein